MPSNIDAAVRELREAFNVDQLEVYLGGDPLYRADRRREELCVNHMPAILDALEKQGKRIAELEAEIIKPAARHGHGVDCEKKRHDRAGGYLHSETDDTPFDVDGVKYCGRCHRAL